MDKYEELDRLILEQITLGNTFFSEIMYFRPVRKEAQKIDDLAQRKSGADRVVDRRLQALRKRGMIRYGSVYGWQIVC